MYAWFLSQTLQGYIIVSALEKSEKEEINPECKSNEAAWKGIEMRGNKYFPNFLSLNHLSSTVKMMVMRGLVISFFMRKSEVSLNNPAFTKLHEATAHANFYC